MDELWPAVVKDWVRLSDRLTFTHIGCRFSVVVTRSG